MLFLLVSLDEISLKLSKEPLSLSTYLWLIMSSHLTRRRFPSSKRGVFYSPRSQTFTFPRIYRHYLLPRLSVISRYTRRQLWERTYLICPQLVEESHFVTCHTETSVTYLTDTSWSRRLYPKPSGLTSGDVRTEILGVVFLTE